MTDTKTKQIAIIGDYVICAIVIDGSQWFSVWLNGVAIVSLIETFPAAVLVAVQKANVITFIK